MAYLMNDNESPIEILNNAPLFTNPLKSKSPKMDKKKFKRVNKMKKNSKRNNRKKN